MDLVESNLNWINSPDLRTCSSIQRPCRVGVEFELAFNTYPYNVLISKSQDITLLNDVIVAPSQNLFKKTM